MAPNPTASENTRGTENTNEPHGALPFSRGRDTARAVHTAAGGRNASCRLPAALLAEQAEVLLFLPRSAKLTFCLQTHSTDRYRKALWSEILRCCIPGNRGKGMRAEKQQTRAEEKTLTLPKTTPHITPGTASNAAGARGLPGDEEIKAKS